MPGDYRLVIKGHDGAQIGVLDAYESLIYSKGVNEAKEAVLVASYGVTDATDALLDELTEDIILEVQRHPDPTDDDLDWYVDWIGFCQDKKTGVTRAATYKATWTFVHCNNLLKRRLIIPPKDKFMYFDDREYAAPRWLDAQLVSNVMRQIVRWQCVYPDDIRRRIPGLYVQDNEDEPATTGQPGIVYPVPEDPDVFGVLSSYIWDDDLYIGVFDNSGNDLWYSSDAETWNDGNLNRAAWCLIVWDDGGGERMFAGTGYNSTRYGEIYRSNVGAPTGWTRVLDKRYDYAAFMALEVHGAYLYASSGTGYWNETVAPFRESMGHIWRTNDGTTWNEVFDGSGDKTSTYGKYQGIEGLKSWGGYIYAGAVYKDDEPPFGTGLHQARILRSQTGALGTWTVVHTVEGIEKPNEDGDMETQEIDGFCCFEGFGGYLYAGLGDRFNPRYGDGRIYRTDDGTTWTQVFGATLDDHPSYTARGVTWLAVHGTALWAGCGGDSKGDVEVWWTTDGTTWYKSFDGLGHPAPICHTLRSFEGNFFAGLGLCIATTEQWAYQYALGAGSNQWFYEQGEGLGALWRMTDDDGWEPPDWSRQGSGRWPQVLDILQKLSSDSLDTEGGTDFGIIPTDLGGDIQEWLFMVKAPWGTDHRSTSDDPVLLGVPRGNITDPEYGELSKDRPNAVYALGAGQQEERPVLEFIDPSSMVSPWGRKEGTADIQRADTPTEMYQAARAVVQSLGPQETLTFRILETPATRYGAEWEMGDLLTAIFDDVIAHVKVEGVTVRLGANPAVEEIDNTIRLLEIV